MSPNPERGDRAFSDSLERQVSDTRAANGEPARPTSGAQTIDGLQAESELPTSQALNDGLAFFAASKDSATAPIEPLLQLESPLEPPQTEAPLTDLPPSAPLGVLAILNETAAQTPLAVSQAAQGARSGFGSNVDPTIGTFGSMGASSQLSGLAHRFASLVSTDQATGRNATHQPSVFSAGSQANNATLTAGSVAGEEPFVQTGQTFAEALMGSKSSNDSLQNASTRSMDEIASRLMPNSGQQLDRQAVAIGPASLTTGAQTAVTAAPQAAVGQAVPVSAIAIEINRQFSAGRTQFDIRLDPPELGRLNVRLELDASGSVRTHLTVERAETLDMLFSDARTLERALQQVGLKTEPGSVSFSLSSNTDDGGSGGNAGSFSDGRNTPDADRSELESGQGSMFDEEPPDGTLSADGIIAQMYMSGLLDMRV